MHLESIQPPYHQLSTGSSGGEKEQSQKLKSLYQAVELSEDAHKRSTGQPPLTHHTANHPRVQFDEIAAEQRRPNAITSLLRRSTADREYGTAPLAKSGKFNTLKRSILCLKRRGNGERATPPAAVTEDRRNEFFALKRFVFMTLGMPNTSAISSRMQKLSSKCTAQIYQVMTISIKYVQYGRQFSGCDVKYIVSSCGH